MNLTVEKCPLPPAQEQLSVPTKHADILDGDFSSSSLSCRPWRLGFRQRAWSASQHERRLPCKLSVKHVAAERSETAKGSASEDASRSASEPDSASSRF